MQKTSQLKYIMILQLYYLLETFYKTVLRNYVCWLVYNSMETQN